MLTEENKELYEIFFQKNAAYYLNQIESYEETGRCSFSAAAFFLGIFWMAYRKMYVYILVVIGILVAEIFILDKLLALNVISLSIYGIIDRMGMFVWGIVIGLISNRLYILKSQKTINKILNEHTDEEQIKYLVAKEGGTDWIVPIIMLIALISISSLALS